MFLVLLACLVIPTLTLPVINNVTKVINGTDLDEANSKFSYRTQHPNPSFKDYYVEARGFYDAPANPAGKFSEGTFEYDSVPKFSQDDIDTMSYPVKTVQRFKDGDGNIQVVTSYSNREDSNIPIYKERSLGGRHNTQPSIRLDIPPPPKQTIAIAKPYTAGVSASSSVPSLSPKYTAHSPTLSRPKTQEYTAKKTIKFPDHSGELVTEQHEKTSLDGRASSYNTKSSYNTNSKNPTVKKTVKSETNHVSPTVVKSTIVQTPLQVAGSSYGGGYATEDIDDDGGYDGGYSGGYDGGYNGGGGHGHGGGFEKEKGSSFNHQHQAAKGDKGGTGHKSQESYEKGHSESHGHEENKGGTKEESGEKTGHLDEANSYAKGHESDHGHQKTGAHHSKGHKKGHKTKGFRTVHHKDEYKKDEVFYDEEHDIGGESKQGQNNHEHNHAKGGSKKKGHLDSGYREGVKGFSGDKEEGHSYENSKGHSGNHGSKSHHNHHSNFGKASGHKEGEAHGHGGKGYY